MKKINTRVYTNNKINTHTLKYTLVIFKYVVFLSFEQYLGLFCLKYRVNPNTIRKSETYQNPKHDVNPVRIQPITAKKSTRPESRTRSDRVKSGYPTQFKAMYKTNLNIHFSKKFCVLAQ